MMMRSFRLLALGAGVALLAGADLLPAQPPVSPAGVPQRGMRAGLMRDITLSDAQRREIWAIQDRYVGQQRALQDEARAARRASATGRPDSEAVAGIRTRMRELRQRQLAEVRGVLTPAQQASFDRNVAELRERGAGRRGGGRRPGGRGFGGEFGPAGVR